MPSTVSPLEIAWVIINALGVLRWGQRYYVNWRDRAKIATDVVELAPDRIVADIRCIRAIMVVDGLLAYIGVGVLELLLPKGPVTDPEELTAWLIAGLLFFVPVALIITGEVFDRMERTMANLIRDYQRVSREGLQPRP